MAAVRTEPPEPASLAEQFLESLATKPGLCVHVGVREGELALRLSGDGKNLVHGLATSAAAVEQARQKIELAKLSGVVSVEQGSLSRLPYADNLVDLLVTDALAEQLAQGLDVQEVLRVLQPGGVAWLGSASAEMLSEAKLREALSQAGMDARNIEIVRRDGLWAKITKPRPADMDEWTHPRRDASANAVSRDEQVGLPTGVRWVAGPNWPTGHRKSSVPGVVTTAETLVYVFEDEVETPRGPQPQNSLMARDPYNGLLLWKRKTTKAPSPLICVENRVYTVIEEGGPLVALDAKTGELLQAYQETVATPKALYVDGLLVVQIGEGVGCLDAQTGELKWRLEEKTKHFLASQNRVFVHTDDSRRGGPSQFVALDLKSGGEQWRQSTAEWTKGSWDLILYSDDVLVAATSKANHGVSAEDGRLLWSYEYPLIGHGGSYSKVLSLEGLVWVHAAKFEDQDNYAWEGLDPQTGKVVKRVVQPSDHKYKHRCSYDVATERFFVCGSLDFADLETGEYEHFDAARNSCRAAGVIPANGLLYTFPHACGCYAMMRGFLGLAADKPPKSADVLFEGHRLVKGPAYGEPLGPEETRDSQWPTYRHDARRTGSSGDAGPEQLQELWSATIAGDEPEAWSAQWNEKDGGRLSSPVIADSLALVAATDEQRLVALDAASGEQRWSFTAGGRIDCPPTIYRGLCLLGSRDGWVYCLRTRDGELAWKFQAAPYDRRIVAYGQLESPWPVVGGVLVYDELAYFGLGRHAASDGGIYVGAIEPQTGRLVWAGQPEYSGVPDVLNGHDGTVQMASWEFDAKSGKHAAADKPRLQGGRLGLLNDAWYERPIAMRKNLQLWTADNGAEGQIVAFRGKSHGAFRACGKVDGNIGVMSGDAELSAKSESGREWSLTMPLGVRVHGMVLAPERLYIAGLLAEEDVRDKKSRGKKDRDKKDREKDTQDNEERAPLVRCYALEDGKLQSEAAIESSPVHDGVAVADGRVYIATQSGKLICLGEK
jgi:outer membrane protein assembly factor BamB